VELLTGVGEKPPRGPVGADPNGQQGAHNCRRLLVRHDDAPRETGSHVNHVEESTAAGNLSQVDDDGVIDHHRARHGHDSPRGA